MIHSDFARLEMNHDVVKIRARKVTWVPLISVFFVDLAGGIASLAAAWV